MPNLFDHVPGLSLAQGLQAGFQAAGTGLQNQQRIDALKDWRDNAAIRELTRVANEQKLRTNNQLDAASNNVLLGIQKLRPQLYGSPDGYIQALNQISPLGNGLTRRLSSDNKTIETVNSLGQVLGTTPNLMGQAAENALLNAGGISLSSRAQQLPEREKADAKNQVDLLIAKMHGDTQRDVAELGLKAARVGAAGGHGGKGLGGDGNIKFSAEEYTKLLNSMVWQLDVATPGMKLPYDSKTGHVDMSQVTNPDQYARLAQLTDAANRRLASGAGQGAQPVFGAMAGLLDNNNQITKANMEQARKAQEARNEEEKARKTSLDSPLTQSNPYSAEAPLTVNPSVKAGLDALTGVFSTPVPMMQPSPRVLEKYGDPTGATYGAPEMIPFIDRFSTPFAPMQTTPQFQQQYPSLYNND